MRRMLLVLSLLAAAACSRFEGPREVYQKNRSGDTADRRDAKGNPLYDPYEQKQRGRARVTVHDDDPRLGPKTQVDGPGGIGR
jgi:hypothetical protein